MSGCTDNEKIGVDFVDELYDLPDRMAALNVILHLDATFQRQLTDALDNRTTAARGDAPGLADFLDRFGHQRNFLNTHQVKRRCILLGHAECQPQGLEGQLRSVVGMKDGFEHARLPLVKKATQQGDLLIYFLRGSLIGVCDVVLIAIGGFSSEVRLLSVSSTRKNFSASMAIYLADEMHRRHSSRIDRNSTTHPRPPQLNSRQG